MAEDSGLVLVLLPGGTFTMGASPDEDSINRDPEARADESPVHEVTPSPFFLSKYEMTQGQWLRFTGGNPSLYGPPTSVGSMAASRRRGSSARYG